MAAAAAEPPERLCEQAEEALLLSDFEGAEAAAQRCLSLRALDAGLQERCLIVAIQALFETRRLSAARKLLGAFERLEDVPPHALLLWLALALDSEFAGEARLTIQTLLDSKQPQGGSSGGGGGGGGGSSANAGGAGGPAWSRRQYLALLHLYVFEVLLRELREVAEAMRWVQDTTLPISAEERQLLLDELSEHLEQQAQRAGRTLRPDSSASGGSLSAGEAEAGLASGADEAETEEEGWGYLGQQLLGGRSPPRPRRQRQQQHAAPAAAAAREQPGGGSGSGGRRGAARPPEPEIVPDPGCEEASIGMTPLEATVDWLGRCQRQALDAAGALLRSLTGAQQPAGALHQQPGAAGQPDPAAAVQLLASTALGAVLLYALYAERAALRRGARRVRRGVAQSISDLLRMAFSLSVNPAAPSAGAAAWR